MISDILSALGATLLALSLADLLLSPATKVKLTERAISLWFELTKFNEWADRKLTSRRNIPLLLVPFVISLCYRIYDAAQAATVWDHTLWRWAAISFLVGIAGVFLGRVAAINILNRASTIVIAGRIIAWGAAAVLVYFLGRESQYFEWLRAPVSSVPRSITVPSYYFLSTFGLLVGISSLMRVVQASIWTVELILRRILESPRGIFGTLGLLVTVVLVLLKSCWA
jgi:hypothetical protein